MAFAGTMGAAAAMTPIGVMSAPGGALSYATDAISLLKTGIGTVTPIAHPQLANLRFLMGSDQTPPLAAMVLGLADPANADTGALVTAAPAANQHGIPANFGPGRGNWTQNDLERLRVHIQGEFFLAGALTDVGTVSIATRTLVGSDLVILVRNMNPSDALGITIDLEWRHSVVIA